ncbi:MAG: methyltransferase domain-containing protein [Paraburkholderia sp.]|uniref:class I SAM-dependent methyltransferase n=1 Tax=Paraburkholderia sp. TaxID=1926495 RepID=UPI00121D829C|nr:class I SAM-dependent methyltransferase [Paraburkholderia sp.]TAL98135.1 MAG: methyltransferase domain-containing protein [Paraburkholderia sp.]
MSTPLSLELDSVTLAEQYDRLGTRQFHHGLELLDVLAVQSGEKVLDIGCGTGLLTEAVAERTGPDGEVLGIDPLALRVELARKRAQGRFDARIGRAEALHDVPDAHYDVVYFNSVIHWVPDQLAALQHAFRVLKPGGRVGFTTMSQEAPHDLHVVLHALLAREPRWQAARVGAPHQLTQERAALLLAAAGFNVTHNEIREFDDAFETVDEVIAFSRASSFGNFLSALDEADGVRVRQLLGDALEAKRGPRGIALKRRMTFATGRRPAAQ